MDASDPMLCLGQNIWTDTIHATEAVTDAESEVTERIVPLLQQQA